MSPSNIDMLKKLGSGVRPDGAARRDAPLPIEQRGFDQLLAGVRSGGLSSGRAITIPHHLPIALEEFQSRHLADAADVAEASAAASLHAIVNDQLVIVDVADRKMTEVHTDAAGLVLSEVEAFVFIPDDDATPIRGHLSDDQESQFGATRSDRWQGPSSLQNRSMAELLSTQQHRNSGADVARSIAPGAPTTTQVVSAS